jgi:hypothetical protein
METPNNPEIEVLPRRSVLCVDMDGSCCIGTAWTPEEVMELAPNQPFIDAVNARYTENFVIIHTARRDHLIPATLEWLRRNGVHYHAISNHKIGAEEYWDDRSYRPDEVVAGETALLRRAGEIARELVFECEPADGLDEL